MYILHLTFPKSVLYPLTSQSLPIKLCEINNVVSKYNLDFAQFRKLIQSQFGPQWGNNHSTIDGMGYSGLVTVNKVKNKKQKKTVFSSGVGTSLFHAVGLSQFGCHYKI